MITNFAKYKNLLFISAKYMELSLEEKKKYIFFGIVCGGQFILFLILKFYFFGSFKAKVVAEATQSA